MEQIKAYFDHNATTPIRPAALAAVTSALADGGNPSSIHSHGRMARKQIETARKIIGDTLDVSAGQVFFNSGATEGNNTIIKGFAGERILVSGIEHPSIIDCGIPVETIPVTSDGTVDLNALATQLQTGPAPALVSVMVVNNETGVIQPIAEIAKLAKSAGARIHCDAVQAYGRIPFTRESLGVDFITISSHKIGGPHGVGALITAPNLTPPKLLQGGGQERRARAGTENIEGIAGFGAAANEATSTLDYFSKLSVLRDKIEQELVKSGTVKIHGQKSARVANTISCTIDGVDGDTLLMAFDIEGISLSGGSACSSGTVRFSHVLKSMGIEERANRAALRISLGWTTTEREVEQFITVWNKLRTRLLKDNPQLSF